MRKIPAAKLVTFVAAIMRGIGCSEAEAHAVATRLVDANCAGHESHGVIRVPKYLEWVRDGTLHPNASPTLVMDTATLAIIDGNRGFGQVVGEYATRIGIEKAASTGIAMIGLRNCGHLGRVGDWAEMAAAAGQVSLHFLNTSGAQRVAPFGGSDRRLSTNPISIGVPLDGADPVILDVTTSTVAEGKLMVALNKDERVPEGWIIDRAGAPTTDPKAFYDGGALLTIGAHKGSGLSIVTDLLAGALTTGRSSDPQDTVLRNNMLSIYIAPAVYAPDGAVAREARRFVDWVKASPPRDPGQPVLAPGDVERRTRAERSRTGVPVDDKTWSDLLDAANSVGVAPSQYAGIAEGNPTAAP
jgi:Malate/L-lactate dehydrogenases